MMNGFLHESSSCVTSRFSVRHVTNVQNNNDVFCRLLAVD